MGQIGPQAERSNELPDLESDPGEKEHVGDRNPVLAKDLRPKLRAWMKTEKGP